jgi:hypothetical protein
LLADKDCERDGKYELLWTFSIFISTMETKETAKNDDSYGNSRRLDLRRVPVKHPRSGAGRAAP